MMNGRGRPRRDQTWSLGRLQPGLVAANAAISAPSLVFKSIFNSILPTQAHYSALVTTSIAVAIVSIKKSRSSYEIASGGMT